MSMLSGKNLYDLIQLEIAAGRVTESRDGNLVVYKYSETCNFEKTWNDVNRRCRGLVFDLSDPANPRQLTNPFSKFFNLGEQPETKLENLPNEPFEVFEKVDGSCGIGFIDPATGKWRLATPGSLVSEQAIRGSEMLQQYDMEAFEPDDTPIFEIIYPENRIVVDYKQETKLVLLTIFASDGYEVPQDMVDVTAGLFRFPRPKRYDYKDLANVPFEDGQEGYVVRFKSGLRLKVKDPRYVRVHRLLGYVTPKRVLCVLRGQDEAGETMDSIRSLIPSHIAAEFDDISSVLIQRHDKLVATARAAYDSILANPELVTRKDKALWIQANTERAAWGLIFGLLDGKFDDDHAWGIVEKELANA